MIFKFATKPFNKLSKAWLYESEALMRQRGDLSLHRWKTCHMDLRGCFGFCRWRRRALCVHSPCLCNVAPVWSEYSIRVYNWLVLKHSPPLPLSKNNFHSQLLHLQLRGRQCWPEQQLLFVFLFCVFIFSVWPSGHWGVREPLPQLFFHRAVVSQWNFGASSSKIIIL